MRAKKERSVEMVRGEMKSSETPWMVEGRYLEDLPPSFGRRPEDHAVGGALSYTDWGEKSATDLGYTEVMYAEIPGPDLDARLYGD